MTGLAGVMGGCFVFIIVMGIWGDDLFGYFSGDDNDA